MSKTDDDSDEETERIDQLEAVVREQQRELEALAETLGVENPREEAKKYTRRAALGLGAAGVAGAAGYATGSAQAQSQPAGTIGDGDEAVDVQSVNTEELNNIKVASSWSDLKTKVEASGRGDLVTVVQGDSAGVLNADSLITAPRYVNVDLKAVEVVPQSDTQDLWDVGEGSHIHTGRVLPSSTYSGSVFVFDGDRETINYWEDTQVSGKVNPNADAGTFVGHEFTQAAGGSVAGVTVDTVQRGGNAYATFASSDANGYLNGNRFRGRVFGAVDGFRVDDATGAVDGNHLIGMGLHAKSRTDDVLDLAGQFWWGFAEVWDLGPATNGINFQPGAENCYIATSHPSVTLNNMTGGGTDNRLLNMQTDILYYDTGTLRRLWSGQHGEEAAGAGNAPTAGNWPTGAHVRNTDDNTIWLLANAGFIQTA
jgi:hypothetical protein